MRKIYVDNATTSFPKAPSVSDAIKAFLDCSPANINRGGYAAAYDVATTVAETRQMLCDFFGFDTPRNAVFTPSVTYSLNMILRGFLGRGDHIITTSMEHNGLMRPLHDLAKNGVKIDIAQCDSEGTLDPKDVKKLIEPETKAVVMTHASNVCGTILPIQEVSQICKTHGIKFILDAAQTAGSVRISMKEDIDALCFTAHKGLLSSPGLGGMLIKSDFAALINPIITGGTGSGSHNYAHPTKMPDKFEAGTPNTPAIIGLREALGYINRIGIDKIFAKEMELTQRFLTQISGFDGVNSIGKKSTVGRTATVSLDFKNHDNAEISAILDERFGIMTRCGLHCSPAAHKTLGTYPNGTVRFSFGYFNTIDDIDYITRSIKWILDN